MKLYRMIFCMEYHTTYPDLGVDDALYISSVQIPKSFSPHVYPDVIWHIVLDQNVVQRYSRDFFII